MSKKLPEVLGDTGVQKRVLYALLGRLVEQGEVVKEHLPGGSVGYALPREGTLVPTAPSGAASAPAA